MESLKIKIDFIAHGVKQQSVYPSSINQNLVFDVSFKEIDGLGKVINVKIIPNQEVTLVNAVIDYPLSFANNDRIFCNGYQSWTDSKEFYINEKLPKPSWFFHLSKVFAPIDRSGDYTFKKYRGKKGQFHSYSYTYIRNKCDYHLIGTLTERQGYTIFDYNTASSKVYIKKDCLGKAITETYDIFDLIDVKGDENKVFDTYFDVMNIKKPIVGRANGYTSWYNHYSRINENVILDNLNAMANSGSNIDFFQIDDGFQTKVGDWLSVDKTKFPNGLKPVVEKIKAKCLKPGLWLAPFNAQKDSTVFVEHPDWFIKDRKGKPLCAGLNWGPFYTLDIYNPEARAYIKNIFDVVLNDWGFELVKLDFLYSICIVPIHNKTRGQIMTEAMEFIRECVKDKLILGCGVPLFPCFGLVDYCRIGMDISLSWDSSYFGRRIHRENVSTKKAIANSIFRRHLDNRAFANDPDVFLLRDDNITLTEEQKSLLSKINNIYGKLLFTSDNVAEYSENQYKTFRDTMDVTNRTHVNAEYIGKEKLLVEYLENNKLKNMQINLKNGKII